MAECTDNATSVHELTVQEPMKENYDNEIRSKSPDEKMNDSISQMSDDESVVTIGEIGIDEYFDDACCDNNLSIPVINDTRANSEPSTSRPSTSTAAIDTPDDEPINVLQIAVDSVHPDIIIKEERITIEERE